MVDEKAYQAYIEKNTHEIRELLINSGVQPVLFLGSGVTKRYTGAPNWMELLEEIADHIGLSKSDFARQCQRLSQDEKAIGSWLVAEAHAWGWEKGQNHFPVEYFAAETDQSCFFKNLVAQKLSSYTLDAIDECHHSEIELFKKISPHAVITTNFERIVNELYDDYEEVIGEAIIPLSNNIIGEIYKIHGSIEDPMTMTLTSEDYARFQLKRKYISSKMMTYFAEFPVFILGYNLGDPNVNKIISDLGEALRDRDGLLENVFYVQWVPNISEVTRLKEEHVIAADGDGPELRVRTIVTSDFDWILGVLAELAPPVKVDVKALRHLAAKVIDLVRHDAPNHELNISYNNIHNLPDSSEELLNVLGLADNNNPNLDFPYTITEIARMHGLERWQHLYKFIPQFIEEIGFDYRTYDNEYYCHIRTGARGNGVKKYSQKFVEVVTRVLERNHVSKPALEVVT